MISLIFATAVIAAPEETLSMADLKKAMNALPAVETYNRTKRDWIEDSRRRIQCDAERYAMDAAAEVRNTIFSDYILIGDGMPPVAHKLTEGDKHYLEYEARLMEQAAADRKIDCGS